MAANIRTVQLYDNHSAFLSADTAPDVEVLAGENRMLVVEVTFGVNPGATGPRAASMTYGGIPLTRLTYEYNWAVVEKWYLLNPPVGVADLSWTLSNSAVVSMTILDIAGVNQTTPWRTPATAKGSTAVTSVVVESQVGDLVIGHMYLGNATVARTITPGPQQTNLSTRVVGTNFWDAYHSVTSQPGGNGTTTAQWTNDPTNDWAVVAAAIVPATPLPRPVGVPNHAGGGAQLSRTWTHVAGSASANRAIVLAALYGDGGAPVVAATVNGIAATHVGTAVSGTNAYGASVYILAGIAAGDAACYMELASAQECWFTSIEIEDVGGVRLGSVMEAYSGGIMPAAVHGVDVPAMLGDLVLDLIATNSAPFAVGAAQVAILDVANSDWQGASYRAAAEPTTRMEWTSEVAFGTAAGLVAFALTPPSEEPPPAGGTLAADPASFTVTAHDAGLLAHRRVVADPAAFALSGHDADLLRHRRLAADPSAYAIDGHDAALRASRRLTAEAVAFALTGHDAELVYAAITGYTLTAETGTFAVTGHDAGFQLARRLLAESAAFTLTGVDALLLRGLRLSADTGLFSLSGHDAALLASRVLRAETGAFTVLGVAADLDWSGAPSLVRDRFIITLVAPRTHRAELTAPTKLAARLRAPTTFNARLVAGLQATPTLEI